MGFDLWHPKYMYGYLKQWYNPKLLWVGLIPSYFIWDSAYLAFWAILCLFYCSLPHHTTKMANVPSIVGVFWPYAYMEGMWVLKSWSNFFSWCCGSLFLNGIFGYGNMTCWLKCNVCVLEARIMYVWGIMLYEGSRPLVHPLWVWNGWMGGILVHHAGSRT